MFLFFFIIIFKEENEQDLLSICLSYIYVIFSPLSIWLADVFNRLSINSSQLSLPSLIMANDVNVMLEISASIGVNNLCFPFYCACKNCI